MGNFREDIKKGEAFELAVLEILNGKGHKLIKNPEAKGIDLLIVKGGIECKMDEFAKYSGNFYIEYECSGKPSGIFKEEKHQLEYRCHSDGDVFFILDGEELKQWVSQKINDCRANKSLTSKGFKLIEAGGNGGKTKGLLVPFKELEAIAKEKHIL